MKTQLTENKEYDVYYKQYIDQAPDLGLVEALESSYEETLSFLKNIPEDKILFRYAPEKWSLKEIVQHLIDTERMFQYRALRISRNDKSPIQGYDHNVYVEESQADHRTYSSLLEEYNHLRKSTILFYTNMFPGQVNRIGLANGKPFSPLAIGYVICGHEKHHVKVFKERYME